MKPARLFFAFIAVFLLVSCGKEEPLPDAAVAPVVREAYIYGYPMVINYGAMYAAAINVKGAGFRKPFNEFYMSSRPDTPDDPVRQTESLDVGMGGIWFDLRREPYVLTVPAIGKERYFSLQFTDLYGYNFAHINSRKTRRTEIAKEEKFLIAGPGWKGEKPEGVERIIQSETQFVYALLRVERLLDDDVSSVGNIQDQFSVRPLSVFAGKQAPAEVAEIVFPEYSDDKLKTPAFFEYMNFVMQFAVPPKEEAGMLNRFSQIGVAAGKDFDAGRLKEERKAAFQAGVDEALASLADFGNNAAPSQFLHGTRADMKGDYPARAYGVMVDQFGATPREILTIVYRHDSGNRPLNGEKNYRLRFEMKNMRQPAVDGFWTVTMYSAPDQKLVANPVDRYRISGAYMLTRMAVDQTDGGMTIFIQKNAPQQERYLPNWLPAPTGDFYVVMRQYLPWEEAFNGFWKVPPIFPEGAAIVPIYSDEDDKPLDELLKEKAASEATGRK